MNSLLADIRFALRQLRKSPGFAATAILTLALGIGATTAIFTLVYQVMLRSLPVDHPEQLYKVGAPLASGVNQGAQRDWNLFSSDLYRYLRDQTPGTAGIAAVQSNSTTVSARRAGDPAAAQPLEARFISGNYFPLLGVKAYAGRLLSPDDDRQGASPVAVISYALWQTKFGGDARLLGSTLLLSSHPVTVVGITASGFLGERAVEDPPGLWLPLAQEIVIEPGQSLTTFPASHWLDLLVRIPEAKQVGRVEQALRGELHQWTIANRGLLGPLTDAQIAQESTELVPASGGISDLRDQYEQSLKLLLLVAGFVLLIACANLANLMLVRGMARQQELAVRAALGAPRLRLIRQMLVEAVLLSLFGGGAAVAVAYAGTRGILALATRGVEFSPLSAAPSLPVLGFALLLSLLTGTVFGIAPAWISSRSSPVEALRGANRSTRDASALPQKLLVILQAALSLVLLSTAGLLITSLRHLEHQDFHFASGGRLLVYTDLQAAGYRHEQLPALYQRMDDAFSRVPTIESFAYATYGPMAGDSWNGAVYQPGVTPDTSAGSITEYDAVSPQFFQVLGTPLLSGRVFTPGDTATTTLVAVVNQAFVSTFLAGKQPLGAHFGPQQETPAMYEIVGVVGNTKYGEPTEAAPPMYFTPMTQLTPYSRPDVMANEYLRHSPANLIVHYHGPESATAAAVRQTLQSINPDIPILKMMSYDDQLSMTFTREELVVRLTTLFGVLALVLASIGLYGVTAYSVARRTSEVGVRMALGATRGAVLTMIVRSALSQALLGLLVGLPLCFVAAQWLQHSLYQTSSFQPFVLIAVAVLLLASALVAAVIPARKAASIDPMRALRTE